MEGFYVSISRRSLVALFVGVASLFPVQTKAGDPPFGYVYTTDTHPQGAWEFEQWATLRTGKSRGNYNLWQLREEVEYGVTNDFQLAGYFNWYSVSANHDKADGTTGGARVPENADPDRRYSATKFDTVALEAIYRLLSPYTDPIGLAVYLEPAIGPDRRELEGRLILHKNFLDDHLVFAANLLVAPEWERQTGNPTADPSDPGSRARWESSVDVDFTTGLTYRLGDGWWAGPEFRNHRVFKGLGFSHPQTSSFFLGPSAHYSQQRWWATLTVMPQLPIAKAYDDESRGEMVHHRNYGEHERAEIRFKAGIAF
jgi:hypothetical protein